MDEEIINWEQARVGEVILGLSADVRRPNHVRSGFRILEKTDKGLKVERIHSCYLGETVDAWVIRWDQLTSKDRDTGEVKDKYQLLPHGVQLPLL